MDDKSRVEFKGQVDQKGHFTYGRLTQYNLKSGLEEVALEGSFENGRLNGKIRYRHPSANAVFYGAVSLSADFLGCPKKFA